jgi:hypothetical protein
VRNIIECFARDRVSCHQKRFWEPLSLDKCWPPHTHSDTSRPDEPPVPATGGYAFDPLPQKFLALLWRASEKVVISWLQWRFLLESAHRGASARLHWFQGSCDNLRHRAEVRQLGTGVSVTLVTGAAPSAITLQSPCDPLRCTRRSS